MFSLCLKSKTRHKLTFSGQLFDLLPFPLWVLPSWDSNMKIHSSCNEGLTTVTTPMSPAPHTPTTWFPVKNPLETSKSTEKQYFPPRLLMP